MQIITRCKSCRQYLIFKYFLSSRNAIFILVVDTSLPIEKQKSQVQYWIRYLKSQLSEAEKVPMLIVGNKEDLLVKGNSHFQQVQEYFASLQKQSVRAITASSTKFMHIKGVIDIIREMCTVLLKDKEYFKIPHLYKRVGVHIKSQRETAGIYLLGNKEIIVMQRGECPQILF